jgi:glycosyltransferase involved in cell wall biosynthesis
MNILFYGPFNSRSRDTESVILALEKKGHNVSFISLAEGKDIIPFLISRNVKAFSFNLRSRPAFINFFIHLFFLIRYCYKNRINLLFSHLESSNFIAVAAQFFMKAKVVINRHHADDFFLNGWSGSMSYRFTNAFCKSCIVFSSYSKKVMIEKEGMKAKKINVINLSYDFSLYQLPVKENSNNIRDLYKCDLLLVSVGRLTENKRFEQSIRLVHELTMLNLDVKLLLLGEGDLKSSLQNQINNSNLSTRCFLLGRVNNVIDYMDASDILIHPSRSESSCVVVKEAGLVRKPVIVCGGVGDFDDYLVHEKNGFVVRQDNFVAESKNIIISYLKDKNRYRSLGDNLNKDIIRLFSIDKNIELYDKYLK